MARRWTALRGLPPFRPLRRAAAALAGLVVRPSSAPSSDEPTPYLPDRRIQLSQRSTVGRASGRAESFLRLEASYQRGNLSGDAMLTIGIIVGSTRPGRKAEAVAHWVHELAGRRTDATFELVDIKDFNLPLLDEARPPAFGNYEHAHTKAWAAKIASLDGFVFVTPEYNHATSGALKNAIDFLFREWNHKAAGFVGYGSTGGVRAVEHLRLVMGELMVADVRAQVALSLFTDWENFAEFKPAPLHEKSLTAMLDQVVAWTSALRPLRQ
jgi:NAD(P)H-dependent FMN reductase